MEVFLDTSFFVDFFRGKQEAKEILKWNVNVLAVTLSWDNVLEVMEKYRLLPNDALIAVTCKHYGIKKIATFDPDFKRVDFLEVIDSSYSDTV